MGLKHKYKDDRNAKQMLADAWLNIAVTEDQLYNPLLDIPTEFDEKPHEYISWVMTRPEYFSFICEQVFNITLLPAQAIMLEEMWRRKFPMLIASRGYGKALSLDTPVKIQNGWKPIQD